MPVDLDKIIFLSEEQNELKKHPRTYQAKKKQMQNLTHWVVVMNGKALVSITKNKRGCELYLEDNPQLYEDRPTIQKLICHDTIQCDCGLTSSLYDYKFLGIYYRCPDKHITKISEYD